MIKIPLATWIANAAAGLAGIYGDVTRRAQSADWSRQTIAGAWTVRDVAASRTHTTADRLGPS